MALSNFLPSAYARRAHIAWAVSIGPLLLDALGTGYFRFNYPEGAAQGAVALIGVAVGCCIDCMSGCLLAIDFLAMADAKDKNDQAVVFDLADEPVIAYTVFPELSKPRAVQRLSDAARIV
jgi:hypothetical protein